MHAARLRHDLRQPLTTIRMNLQAAIRLLQRPEPLVPAALDAILDCLDAEREAAGLLADGD